MDVIRLSGYTEEEKLGDRAQVPRPEAARRARARRRPGGPPDATLRLVISEYTREAGLRNLERQIAALCRKVATQIAEGNEGDIRRRATSCASGSARAASRARCGSARPTRASPRASRDRGRRRRALHRGDGVSRQGRLKVTGQLGEVMQESAQAALSWVRAHAAELGVDPEWFARTTSTSTSRRAQSRRTALGRGHDGDRDRRRSSRASRSRTTSG